MRHDQTGGDGSLAVSHQTISSNVLILGVVDLEDMVLGLGALAHGEEHDALAVAPELARRLLQDGEPLVDLGEDLVANRVGLLDVGRDVFVRLGKIGDDGLRERLVRRVAELERLLAVGVLLDVGQAIAHDGILGEVLSPSCSSASESLVTARRVRLTERVADAGWTSPFTCAAISDDVGA